MARSSFLTAQKRSKKGAGGFEPPRKGSGLERQSMAFKPPGPQNDQGLRPLDPKEDQGQAPKSLIKGKMFIYINV